MRRKRFVVGITGASGAVYGVRMAEVLLRLGAEIHLVVTDAGWLVLKEEKAIPGRTEWLEALKGIGGEDRIHFHGVKELTAPIASGSFPIDGMIVIPCSMGTLSGIAQGASGNLLERAADVMLKEGRPLILVPRETPLHAIHLRNMLTLAEMGVRILPAMPAFYHQPQRIEDLVDFVVGKALDALHIPDHQLYKRWREQDAADREN
ncbi:putative aromatic acid decarboxylase [[Clostridium] ultunense Esp]|uniref:UbiX family flavin prenyltransferase n=1 Tax=Thermicanus aegyptius TaxID=94009 RepID=UPI0002B6F806|nr:putative aromatic acid decarboxylase [[Clostridium] ultunense Esp]